MPSIANKRQSFRRLHGAGCFVLPNPWDVGTARYLQHLGFKALATTSAGFAFSRGRPDLDDAIRRLRAYSAAGADCLYAPGIRTREQISAVVEAAAPKPVNLLVGFASELTVDDIAALGVRRISVGGALARSAWGAFMHAAKTIADK